MPREVNSAKHKRRICYQVVAREIIWFDDRTISLWARLARIIPTNNPAWRITYDRWMEANGNV